MIYNEFKKLMIGYVYLFYTEHKIHVGCGLSKKDQNLQQFDEESAATLRTDILKNQLGQRIYGYLDKLLRNSENREAAGMLVKRVSFKFCNTGCFYFRYK